VTIRCEEQLQALADQEMRCILLYLIPQTLFRVNAEFTSTPSHYMTNQPISLTLKTLPLSSHWVRKLHRETMNVGGHVKTTWDACDTRVRVHAPACN